MLPGHNEPVGDAGEEELCELCDEVFVSEIIDPGEFVLLGPVTVGGDGEDITVETTLED